MTTHREVEQTYAPGSGATLPDLTALPGVAGLGEPDVVELDAVYFDTADLALVRAGVTLRRRTGGGDEGWHLKLPAGTGRDEIRLPLGVATRRPPARLLRLVLGLTRGAPVAAVATITTRRTERLLLGEGGVVLAELADDAVTGDATGGEQVAWREWELELVEGGPELLHAADELMTGSGVPTSDIPRKILHVLGARLTTPTPLPEVGPDVPAGLVLQRRIAEQVAELQRRDLDMRRGRPEGVHQARVACRRLRSALGTYRPLVDRTVTDPLREELKWLGRALADARDAKVVRDRLADLLDAEPADLVGKVERDRIAVTYGDRARVAAAEVDDVLSSGRYFALLDALDRLADDPPWTAEAERPARDVLRRRVRRDRKRLRRSVAEAARTADTPEHDLAMHQARKDAKRLRYAAETLVPAWGKHARRLARASKRLTSVLGDRQDTVVSREHLVELARVAEASGESAFTWGRLHAREQARAEELDRVFAREWPAMARRKKLWAWLG